MKSWSKLRHSILFKFSGAFILVGLIPLFALSVFSFYTITNHVEKYTVNNLQQMMKYMSLNLDKSFIEYNEISKLMYKLNNDMDGVLRSPDLDVTNSVNQKVQINQQPIDEFLRTVLYSDPFIRNAYFVRAIDNKVYFQSREIKNSYNDTLPLETWMVPLRKDPKLLTIIPTHKEIFFFNSNQQVITIGRNLIDTSGNYPKKEVEIAGTLFFDVDVAVFKDLFGELNLGKNDDLFILDANNLVYYSNQQELYGKIVNPNDRNEGKLIISEESSFLKVRAVTRISKSDLYQQLNQIKSAVWLAILICSLALLIMSVLFSRKLSTPIRGIMKQMGKIESGNLDAYIEVKSRDEIGRLAQGFNRMVDRLATFINEAYVAEIKQKQTELNAIKSQIRPHYLYNTLEVIRMNAVANDADEVGDMIFSLSKQLQYVIDYGEEWVTIKRELDHLKDYFYIIEVRYENRIELQINIAENVDLNWQILKLSLQPIVENAIQHGIQPKGGKVTGIVMVLIEIWEDKLSVTVFDDGIGMDEERLRFLNKQLENIHSTSKSVGMRNVNERIRSLCGNDYGLDISTRQNMGTSVRMLFPIRRGLDYDSSHSG